MNREVKRLFCEFALQPASPSVSVVLARALERGLTAAEHFRRTFESLRASCSLPDKIDHKFAEHFTMWLEVINQPYFKPIITAPRRLGQLTGVLVSNRYLDVTRRRLRVVDLGTGQPPYTTIDLANSLPQACIDGFDLYTPSCMVLQPNGAYALFDETGRLAGVHAPELRVLHGMVTDWRQTLLQFQETLNKSQDETAPGKDYVMHRDGAVMIWNPTERLRKVCRNQNLRFHVNRAAGFDLAGVEDSSVDVLWSFNCLLHYSVQVRAAALQRLSRKVRPGGIVMEGYTSPDGGHAVFSLWRREERSLRLAEFGFSTPNFQYPLWPLHGRDPQVEMLNHFVGLVKANQPLRMAIQYDLTAGGSLSPETVQAIVTYLGSQGYQTRAEAPRFIVVECNRVWPAQTIPVRLREEEQVEAFCH